MIKKLPWFFISICLSVYAQNIQPERRTDWKTNFFQVETDTVISAVDAGLVNDGSIDGSTLLNDLITGSSSQRINIYFPAGTYLFTSTIYLKSDLVLTGAGCDSTFFIFNGGGSQNFLQAQGSTTGIETALTNHYHKDDVFVTALDASGLQSGDFIKIIEDDAGRIFSAWSTNMIGQIIEIDTVIGNDIYFSDPLRMDFDSINHPRFIKIDMKKNIGIECLSIERADATVGQTSNIDLNGVAYAYVNGVKSNKTNFAHVGVSNSYNIHVTNSYFKDSHAYGGGGQGYGVVLQYTSGNCLVQNNIFRHLRHSMLLQACANGNILAYNYSIEPNRVEIPNNAAGDLVLHGNYPFMNLFEGNTVQNIMIDDSHGVNGPYNTFYRNRAELYGLVMTQPLSDNQNFVGNEMTDPGALGFYLLSGIGHYEYGNNDAGTIVPAGTNIMQDTTLFLVAENPYDAQRPVLPKIGYPNIPGLNLILAEINQENDLLASCMPNLADTSWQVPNPAGIHAWETDPFIVYPNPGKDQVMIKGLENEELIEIYNSSGILCTKKRYTGWIDISFFGSGIYFIKIREHFYKLVKV